MLFLAVLFSVPHRNTINVGYSKYLFKLADVEDYFWCWSSLLTSLNIYYMGIIKFTSET